MLNLIARATTRLAATLAIGLLAASSLGASAALADAVAVTAPRVINVTTDSAPGWTPSVELEHGAREALDDFLGDLDGGRGPEAYNSLVAANRRDQSLATFSLQLAKFNTLAGAVRERRITQLTWTKDPANAPAPGVYAAFDLTSRFANVDRHCGYVVLYQSPNGGAFQVMRQEYAYIDNATALDLEKQEKGRVITAWSQLSATCPNYHDDAPLPEEPHSNGGMTVAATLADLRSRKGVTLSEQSGWTIADEASTFSQWSFTPAEHPANPAFVKRRVVNKKGAAYIDTQVYCEASKAACDDLVRAFSKQ